VNSGIGFSVRIQEQEEQMEKNKRQTFPGRKRPQGEKLAQARKKNKSLQEEIGVLKKAIAILMRE
jgi:hypothetical protein